MTAREGTRAAPRAVLLGGLALLLAAPAATAHEPVFGLGPHTIFQGGVGVELEAEGERASGGGETEEERGFHLEVLYGVTPDLSVTAVVPFADRETTADGSRFASSGLGDIALRAKYRFWRRDLPGTQDAAAVIAGVELPTGDDGARPRIGSGSTDYLLGAAAARESRRWYLMGGLRYRLNTEGSGGFEAGDRFFADALVGVRPRLTEYTQPDLVLYGELNWESRARGALAGETLSDSGGDRLFLAPGFFLTYRNWAVKGGIQIPVASALHGAQPEDDYRFRLALEAHL